MKEALFYEKGEDGKVRCLLCPHHCLIPQGGRGVCGVRENQEGKLYSLVYGKLIAENLDPIEKKPIFHLYPASTSYSIATVGCNLRCLHCQNWEISQWKQGDIPGRERTPEEVVDMALRWGARSISYTYTEPVIFMEFALDTAKIAKEKGLKNIFVTNGYAEKRTWEKILPYLDAANIDLKSFSEDFYREICGGRLSPVLESIKFLKVNGVWVEVTTLIIPTKNDSLEELEKIADFILSVSDEIPWHITAFYPAYRMLDLPPTPSSILRKTREMALRKGLKFVYTGNIPGEEGENTYCPSCGKLIIGRYGFRVTEINIKEGRCKFCNAKIPGIF